MSWLTSTRDIMNELQEKMWAIQDLVDDKFEGDFNCLSQHQMNEYERLNAQYKTTQAQNIQAGKDQFIRAAKNEDEAGFVG